MERRGKPSTFSALGTEKPVVGEEGLDGGSLVGVSIAAVMMLSGDATRRSRYLLGFLDNK